MSLTYVFFFLREYMTDIAPKNIVIWTGNIGNPCNSWSIQKIFIEAQLESIRFVSLKSFSVINKNIVKKRVGKTMKVANHFNFKHQKTSFTNQQVKWDFCIDQFEKKSFIPIFPRRLFLVDHFYRSLPIRLWLNRILQNIP